MTKPTLADHAIDMLYSRWEEYGRSGDEVHQGERIAP